MSQIILLVLACSATVHWVLTCVMYLYSLHKSQYLCLAWTNLIFAAGITLSTFFNHVIATGQPGMLHPVMLLVLVCVCYFQSIYPLSIPMPGFLQWGRMWKYASPAIILIALYLLAMLIGSKPVIVHSGTDLVHNLLSGDLLLRLAAMCLSIYYIVNIFHYPHKYAKNADVPYYLWGYCTMMWVSMVYFVVVSIFYSPVLLIAYVIIFTLLNMYLVFRTLDSIARSLPNPVIQTVVEEPTEEEVDKAEREDFNEANFQRFQRIQFWMQSHREIWTDNTFGRDRLCEEVGYNRHLVLQSVRSQGYNNVHDFINSYRIQLLKQMIHRGTVTTLSDATLAGFGTAKTAKMCFEKMEDESLDKYILQNSPLPADNKKDN